MLEENQIIQIYRDHGRELLIYIYRLTGSIEASEDLLHDCFVNIIKYSQKHNIEEKNIRSFLYKTAHNLSINYLKRKTKIEFLPIGSSIDIQKNDQMVTDLEYSELNNKITELLLKMDNTSRSIFVMRKELGMSIQEIAENTGKSERTVNRRLKTVIDSLLNELAKSGFITIISLLMAFFSSMIVVYYRGG